MKVGAWVTGIAMLLFIGLFFLTDWLQNRLEKQVQQQSDGLYTLELHGLQVSPFIGNLSLDSLALVPDYKRWHKLQKAPRLLFKVQTGAITLTNFNFLGVLFGKPVKVEQVRLQHPELLITAMRPDTTERAKAAYETATGLLKNIYIGSIVVDSAGLQFRKSPQQKAPTLSVAEFTFNAADFKLDSQSYHDPGKAYYARKIRLEATGISYELPVAQYNSKVKALVMDTEKQLLLVKRLELLPLTSARQMSSAKGKAVTSNTVKVREVKATGVNYHAYSIDKSVIARLVQVKEPVLKVFKDRKTGQPEAKKPLPHELVRGIKTSFDIDTIEVKSGYVRYAELATKAATRGHITMEKLHGTITNLTNIPEQISEKNPAVVQASAMVMGKVEMAVTLKIPLLNKNGYHTLSGTIGEGNPEILNAILVPVSDLKIESGYIRRGEFSAELTENSANGKMTVIYSNLEIEMLNKGAGNKQGFGMKLLSEAADIFAIKDANPMPGEKVRVGEITVKRNPTKSMLNYWKDCLASGFLSSIGLQKIAKK